MTDAARPDPRVDPVGGHAQHPESPQIIGRRRFLGRVTLAMSGLIGLVLSVPIVAYLLSPLINRAASTWVSLGRLDQYPLGQTLQVAFDDPSPLPWAGQTARTAVWLRRTGQASFIAFAVNCTHLACPVNWLQQAGLFLCPCHGGVFYADGSVAGGPPPRPLPQYEVRVVDGEVQLLTRGVPIGDRAAE